MFWIVHFIDKTLCIYKIIELINFNTDQLGYNKLSTSSQKLREFIILILLMGINFYVDTIAKLGLFKIVPSILSTMISY